MKKIIYVYCFILIFTTKVFATLEKPLSIPFKEAAWTSLSYSKIPANKVTFIDDTIKIQVQKSAGPLVYALGSVLEIQQIDIQASWTGTKKLETTDFDEDSILRIGLVAPGDKKLSGVKKLFAADWVKKLFSLAPPGSGLDKIYFFNITNRPELLDKQRIHPQSDLIDERIVIVSPQPESKKWTVRLPQIQKTAALWLSVDGDNTQSEFELTLSSLQVQ